MRRFRFWFAGALLVAIHLAALGADLIAPYDYSTQFRDAALEPPTARAPVRWLVRGSPRPFGPFVLETRLFQAEAPARLFLLGTDDSGRDTFSRLLYGARISLFAGLLAASLCVFLGFCLGTVAGFYGGRLDQVLMRCTELFLALPWLYLLFAVRAVLPLELGPGRVFLLFIVIVGAVGWARPARLFRGVAAAARQQDFVLAARALGATDLQLMLRHVLPQSKSVFWTQLALLVPRFILAEVTLSFLGLGVSEPVPSWGNMLAVASGLSVLLSSVWTLAPAGALLLVVLCYQPLADGPRTGSPAGGSSLIA